MEWLRSTTKPNILWLKSMPGAGKSTIARTIVDCLKNDLRPPVSFFFSRNDTNRLTPLALWCHVLYSLAMRYPAFRRAALLRLRADDMELASSQPKHIFDIIVSTINGLGDTDISPGQRPVIIIDALDECSLTSTSVAKQRHSVLAALSQWETLSPYFRLIVTSREEPDICKTLESSGVFAVHLNTGVGVDQESTADIRVFIKTVLPFATRDDVESLVEKAAGLFVWASTAVQWISAIEGLPQSRLRKLLEHSETEKEHLSSLHSLYHVILTDKFGSHPDRDLRRAYQRVMGTILVAVTPFSARSLTHFLSHTRASNPLAKISKPLAADVIESVLSRLAVLLRKAPVSEGVDEPVLQFSHQSFPEFLERADTKLWFHIHRKDYENQSALLCLLVLNAGLKFNICHLESSYFPNSHYTDMTARIRQFFTPSLEYSIKYWVAHLLQVDSVHGFELAPVRLELSKFLSEHMLHWFEAMSLIGKSRELSSMLRAVIRWLPKVTTRILYFARNLVE